MPLLRAIEAWCLSLLRAALPVLLLLALPATPALAAGGTATADPLAQRLDSWPQWQLPAPLPRPGHRDLEYPSWFAGQWQVRALDPDGVEPELLYVVRFRDNSRGAVVGDRAFNAAAVGRAVLGDALLAVQNDPANPNRQIARLSDDRQLESTVVGRRSSRPDAHTFLADELALQVLHGPGEPRVSRVETLSRYVQVGPDRLEADQWQASYGSPAEGLMATARRSWRGRLVLERQG